MLRKPELQRVRQINPRLRLAIGAGLVAGSLGLAQGLAEQTAPKDAVAAAPAESLNNQIQQDVGRLAVKVLSVSTLHGAHKTPYVPLGFSDKRPVYLVTSSVDVQQDATDISMDSWVITATMPVDHAGVLLPRQAVGVSITEENALGLGPVYDAAFTRTSAQAQNGQVGKSAHNWTFTGIYRAGQYDITITGNTNASNQARTLSSQEFHVAYRQASELLDVAAAGQSVDFVPQAFSELKAN